MRQKIAAALACATLACSGASERGSDQAAAAQAPAVPQRDQRGVILFLGTSLTAGYGVGAEHGFPALIQQKLDSAGLPFRVVNAGLSGETSAGGLRRLEWSLQQPVAVLVLELGANDGLRGLGVAQLQANLDSIIVRTRRRYAHTDILVAGMEAPPNFGATYTTAFRNAFRDVARRRHAVLLPFLLQDVAAKPSLNQEDGLHPNEAGHRIVAETVWRTLRPMLQKRLSSQQAQAARE